METGTYAVPRLYIGRDPLQVGNLNARNEAIHHLGFAIGVSPHTPIRPSSWGRIPVGILTRACILSHSLSLSLSPLSPISAVSLAGVALLAHNDKPYTGKHGWYGLALVNFAGPATLCCSFLSFWSVCVPPSPPLLMNWRHTVFLAMWSLLEL